MIVTASNALSSLCALGLPDGTPAQLRCACRLLAALVIAAAGALAGEWGTRLQGLCAEAVVVTAVCGWGSWLTALVIAATARRRDDLLALIRQNAELWTRIPPQDRPALLGEAGR